MTHGKLWPAHPKPFDDELLSSWVVRVIQANGIKLQTLSRMLFGENLSPWMRDIDRTPPLWLMETFCYYTGVNNQTALMTTLDTYKDILFHDRRISGHQKWILTLRQSGTKRLAHGQQFCPACLADDVNPYFRKHWRVALFTYCPLHQIELYDACPRCNTPIMYYRVDFGRDIKKVLPIYACFSCGFDLRASVHSPVCFPSDELHNYYDELLGELVCGDCGKAGYSVYFFDVLHQLCKVMGTRKNQGKLLGYVLKLLSMSVVEQPTGWTTIEERRRDERFLWLLAALWLTMDLESRLYEAWKAKVVRYSSLNKDFLVGPSWYRSVLQRMV